MQEIETNINMDTTKCRARSCDASNITDQESQWSLQMFTPIMKQETVQHLDEEEIPQSLNEEETVCNDCMNPCKPLQTSDCVDNSDCKFYVLEQLKKEFPEDQSPQPLSSISSKLVFENEELSQVIVRHECIQENSVESLSLIKNEDVAYEQYPVIVKIESLEEHKLVDNCGDTGVHYDVLVVPQQVQCKLCDRTFENRLILLKHNNEHIKVVMYPIQVDNEMNELHQCKCCDEHCNSHNNMLAHVRDVDNNERHKCESYDGIKPYLNRKNGVKIQYKCDLCERLYKSKDALVVHKKMIHVDYGRMFECWCGKQFRTPIHLSRHERRQHCPKINIRNNEQFQCDSCHKLFNTKSFLRTHIKKTHYDYGKTFECSCGKQFRTPFHLSQHKRRKHDPNVKIINNEQFQCDSCHKFFKTKTYLARHIHTVHYDYGKTFECACGKQFRTPIHLYDHRMRLLCADVKNINSEGFQCHICQKLFKTKKYLRAHIKNIHHSYGETFECSCGKQFRTPVHLSDHKKRVHDDKNINNERFHCHICLKLFKAKMYLKEHIKNIHYSYGKTFECSCGKQFRTPVHLSDHKKRVHNDKNINNERFHCHSCPKLFKTKMYLATHIKNVHFGYGSKFVCWCGKQFRTPLRLRVHERYLHKNKSKDMAGVNTNIAI